MHQPTSKQVTLVIKNLKKIEKAANAENMFEMWQAMVSCGSPACVGGWYAIAVLEEKAQNRNYIVGANLMARDLGFTGGSHGPDHGYLDLEEWAEDNDEIWGNYEGSCMFQYAMAYNDLTARSKDPMTIVIAHWTAVRNRLREMEKCIQHLNK